jgi:hypothetical protein
MTVATQVTTTAQGTRTAPRLGGFEIAILAVIAAAVLGLAIWSQIGPRADVTLQSQPYGISYPLHGGLAGPSRISVFHQFPVGGAGSFAPGYPLHGGLAGPSRVSFADDAGSFAPGYPLHGGLAGPSRLDDGD